MPSLIKRLATFLGLAASSSSSATPRRTRSSALISTGIVQQLPWQPLQRPSRYFNHVQGLSLSVFIRRDFQIPSRDLLLQMAQDLNFELAPRKKFFAPTGTWPISWSKYSKVQTGQAPASSKRSTKFQTRTPTEWLSHDPSSAPLPVFCHFQSRPLDLAPGTSNEPLLKDYDSDKGTRVFETRDGPSKDSSSPPKK